MLTLTLRLLFERQILKIIALRSHFLFCHFKCKSHYLSLYDVAIALKTVFFNFNKNIRKYIMLIKLKNNQIS